MSYPLLPSSGTFPCYGARPSTWPPGIILGIKLLTNSVELMMSLYCILLFPPNRHPLPLRSQNHHNCYTSFLQVSHKRNAHLLTVETILSFKLLYFFLESNNVRKATINSMAKGSRCMYILEEPEYAAVTELALPLFELVVLPEASNRIEMLLDWSK